MVRGLASGGVAGLVCLLAGVQSVVVGGLVVCCVVGVSSVGISRWLTFVLAMFMLSTGFCTFVPGRLGERVAWMLQSGPSGFRGNIYV